MIDWIIIGTVLHQALTGYDIKKTIDTGIGNIHRLSNGSLYPALKKLTDKGYLTLTEQTHTDRLKKYYLATDQGREAFTQWLLAPIDTTPITPAILSKVFFFDELTPELQSAQLLAYEQLAEKLISDYKHIEQTAITPQDLSTHYFSVSTLYYAIETGAGLLHWLRHIRAGKALTDFAHKEDTHV